MSTKVHEVIKLLSAAFRKKFNDYKGLYIFGIYLDGQEHAEEDLELVAIFEHQDKTKREEIWPIVGHLETQFEINIDLYPYTEAEFRKDEELYNKVITEGIFYNPLGITKKFN